MDTDPKIESDGADTRQNAAGEPIFILGIMQRSGTRFLCELISAHPDCCQPPTVHEDYLLCYGHILQQYIAKVEHHWPDGTYDETVRQRLQHCLGSGLERFLQSYTDGRRAVTKTPRIDNLRLFSTFFPIARMLIIVRDGRAVIESGRRSFRWPREAATRVWADAAESIVSYDRNNAGPNQQHLIVRYEDLWCNQRAELERIFRFVGLDPDRYDFESAQQTPIRGSSTTRAEGGQVHWKPVERTADFDPMSRWKHWRRGRHMRFNWVAGRYLDHFGYEQVHQGRPGLLRGAWFVLLDAAWRPVYAIWKRYIKKFNP